MMISRHLIALGALTLLVGGFGFSLWYLDPEQSVEDAFNRGKEFGRLEERKVQQEAAAALLNAIRSANPFIEDSTENPLRDAYQNPYGELKENPFE